MPTEFEPGASIVMIRRVCILAAVLIAVLTPADAQRAMIRATAFKDPAIGIEFPYELAGLRYQKRTDYPDPGLGYSVYYAGRDGTKVDIYVYDKETQVPTGYDNSAVRAEAEASTKDLKTIEKVGRYKDVSMKGSSVVPSSGNIRFLEDKYEYSEVDSGKETKVSSERLITGVAGKFIKVRVTSFRENQDAGHSTAVSVADELAKILADAKPSTLAPSEKQKILDAIAEFKRNPKSNAAAAAVPVIVNFAQKSDKVEVTISSAFVSVGSGADDRMLLPAFIAGSVEPQLRSGKQSDCSYDGVVQEIDTYNQLRRSGAEKNETVEEFIDLQRSGRLRDFVEKHSRGMQKL